MNVAAMVKALKAKKAAMDADALGEAPGAVIWPGTLQGPDLVALAAVGAEDSKIPQKVMDALAATLRGATSATLGLPGDIEGLGRMGINALGGNVSPESALPNTDDFSKKHLPSLNPMVPTEGGEHPMEMLGQLLSLGGGAVKATQLAKKLRARPRVAQE